MRKVLPSNWVACTPSNPYPSAASAVAGRWTTGAASPMEDGRSNNMERKEGCMDRHGKMAGGGDNHQTLFASHSPSRFQPSP
jgi:hypothetical protein